MSSIFTIEPRQRKKKTLSFELKKTFQKKFGGVVSSRILDRSDIQYIQALIDLEIPDAEIILEYIEKYDEVIIDEEF